MSKTVYELGPEVRAVLAKVTEALAIAAEHGHVCTPGSISVAKDGPKHLHP